MSHLLHGPLRATSRTASADVGARLAAARTRLQRLRAGPDDSARIEELLPRFDAGGRHAGDVPRLAGAIARAGRDGTLRARWHAAVSELPSPHAEILLLHDAEGCDAGSLADALGLPRDRMRRCLHEARLALCTLLARSLEGSR